MRRAFLIVTILTLSAAGLWFGWGRIKERYLLPWVGGYLAHQVEQRSGWHLSYRGITGNLLTELHLVGVRLTPKQRPAWLVDPDAELALLADAVHAHYRPRALVRGLVEYVWVEDARIQLGKLQMGLSVVQTGDVVAVSWPAQQVSLDALRPLLAMPERVTIEGDVRIGGEWLLKGYRPHLMQVRLQGEDLRLRWVPKLDARFDLDLELNGPSPAPSLAGRIDLTKGRWSGVGGKSFGSAMAGDSPAFLKWAAPFPGLLMVHLDGQNFWVHTEKLHAKFGGDVMLRKTLDEPPRLVGQVAATEGNYNVRRRRFTLRHGMLTFPDRVATAPRLDAELETRVKRYRIRAGVYGTLRESHLQLTSQPPLTHEEILALMVFGRRIDRLSREEREQLAQQDAGTQALDLLFLGQAELLAARMLGLDEINVSVAPYTAIGTATSPIESVEIGKYVIPDRLFGSYQLEPGLTPSDPYKHTVGAEYEVTDTLSVEATLKAAVKDTTTASTQTVDATQPQTSGSTSRRLEPEEALIRFRWKF
jgi:hypothetical protein